MARSSFFSRLMAPRARTSLGFLLVVVGLASCSNDDSVSYPELNLTVAHINDHHSNIDPLQDFEIGYTTFGTVFKEGRYVNTYLLYSQTFVDYLKARPAIARPPRADYAHKSVVTKAGVALQE